MSLDLWLHAVRETEVHHTNVTHNLGRMAKAAGLYECMWEAKGKSAEELIEPLEKGIAYMREHYAEMEELNPPNGWGSYLGLLEAAEALLRCCRENEDATVTTWR